MIRLFFFIVVAFLLSCNTKYSNKLNDANNKNKTPHDTIVKNINKIASIIQTNSIYSESLNWTEINSDLKHLSVEVEDNDDYKIIVDYFIEKLRQKGDFHSFYSSKEEATLYNNSNMDARKPRVEYLNDNIGYVYIPGFMSSNDSLGLKFAQDVQNMIKSIDKIYSINKFIIDLRENTGGNMYPMIAGLGPILGEDTLGYFLSNKQIYEPWFYSNGSVWVNRNTVFKINQPYQLKSNNIKIAVLIGNKTGSSGEITAISFIGKGNCKLFGESSSGYTTGNTIYPLFDGSYIGLATSLCCDRNKKKYSFKIQPDYFTQNYFSKDDYCLKYAKLWLTDRIDNSK